MIGREIGMAPSHGMIVSKLYNQLTLAVGRMLLAAGGISMYSKWTGSPVVLTSIGESF